MTSKVKREFRRVYHVVGRGPKAKEVQLGTYHNKNDWLTACRFIQAMLDDDQKPLGCDAFKTVIEKVKSMPKSDDANVGEWQE